MAGVEEYLKFSCASRILSTDNILHCTTKYLLGSAPGDPGEKLQSGCVDCSACFKCWKILELFPREVPVFTMSYTRRAVV